MAERKQKKRWRCVVVGCNPVLPDDETAEEHHLTFEHRVAKWPIRSPSGIKKAKARNKSGYYDKYNVGDKSLDARIADGHMADPYN